MKALRTARTFYDYEFGVVRDVNTGEILIPETLARYGFTYSDTKMLYRRPDNWQEPTAHHEFDEYISGWGNDIATSGLDDVCVAGSDNAEGETRTTLRDIFTVLASDWPAVTDYALLELRLDALYAGYMGARRVR